MPELYAALDPRARAFPARYLGANVPQAWAAGSCFSLLQAMLGFQPDAPNRMLYFDPVLPDWLPSLTLRNLRLAGDSFDIRFVHEDSRTAFEVVKGPKAHVQCRPMVEWSDRLRSA